MFYFGHCEVFLKVCLDIQLYSISCMSGSHVILLDLLALSDCYILFTIFTFLVTLLSHRNQTQNQTVPLLFIQ